MRVWEADTGQPIGKLIEVDDQISRAQLSADGKRLLIVFGGDSEAVQTWDVDAARRVGPDILYSDLIQDARFSPSGKEVVTVYGGQYERGSMSEKVEAQVWDAQTGQPVGKPLSHAGRINCVEFSPDGRFLVTASDDRTARVWDARTGEAVGIPMQHADRVNSARFSPDGRWMVTAAADNTVRVWPARTGCSFTEAVRFDSAARIAGPEDKGIAVEWSDDTARSQVSPDGRHVLTRSPDGTAQVWDAASGKPAGPPLRCGPRVASAELSPDGKRVVTASEDGFIRIWDVQSPEHAAKEINFVHFPDAPIAAKFSPDGQLIVAVSSFQIARMWDARSGEPFAGPIRNGDLIQSAVFTRDGKGLMTTVGSAVQVWDVHTGRPLTEAMRHQALVTRATFSRDGRWVVTEAHDGTARIWDAQTGRSVSQPLAPGIPVYLDLQSGCKIGACRLCLQ